MPRPLSEQVVVITGASSGIGRCAAQHFAGRGARVVLTARRAEALRALAEEIRAAGGRALAVPGDVVRLDDMEVVARAAEAEFGRIDTWINNAAVYIQGGIDQITLDEYRRILDVNVIGVINGTQRALERMLRQGGGVIIQVSSIVGKRGAPFAAPYSAAKHAVDGFTEAARAEYWGTHIHFATLYLPSVDTPIYQHARGKFGTMPKPTPPVELPERAARTLAALAENPKPTRYLGLFRHIYIGADRLSPSLSDWMLHHAAGFTLSRRPAGGDNVDRPLATMQPTVRGGWANPGWHGLTLGEVVRVLPVESMIASLAAGFAAARVLARVRRRGEARR